MRRLALLAWARAFFRRHLRVRWIRSSQTPLPCSSDKVLTAAPALARPLTVCGETYAPYCFVAIVALFLMSSSPASGQSRTPEITSETILTATLTPEAPLVTGSSCVIGENGGLFDFRSGRYLLCSRRSKPIPLLLRKRQTNISLRRRQTTCDTNRQASRRAGE